jgi:hypothetical protein
MESSMSLTNRFARHTGLAPRDIEIWQTVSDAERVEDYVARWRPLRRLTDDEARGYWKGTLAEFARDPHILREADLADAYSELELREIPAPYIEVWSIWLKAREHFIDRLARCLAEDEDGKLRREVLECVEKIRRAEN